MKLIQSMSQAELAAYVHSHLFQHGVDVVLSGGAVVTLYSHGKYVSLDIDLVPLYYANRKELKVHMERIGFESEGRHFVHSETEYFIEFPPGPLSVGSEQVSKIDELDFSTGKLRIISPTDCVKDRLSAYYHWADKQSLEQAILVAKDNPIDIEEIKRWSENEGKLGEFNRIMHALE